MDNEFNYIRIPVWREEDYPETPDLRCIKIYIPDDDTYMAQLAALVSIVGDVLNYALIDLDHANIVAEQWRNAYAEINWTGCETPPEGGNMSSSIMLFPDKASVTSGGTPSWTSDTASSLGGYWIVNPALTADSMRWDFYLAQGKYNIDMTYLRNTVNGKGDLKVYDESLNLIATIAIDLRGAIQRNTVSGGSFDNPTGGRIRVEWVGTGASLGTSYFRSVQRIWIDKYDEL